ncbi:tyrosine-type recombinase/integrase [Paenibacillus roseipurpureus]|uniref:Phage integrase N-terminal SAM-like domain-containing protein n=1 Tax=Paenibacillus roseopurpureus TaxID=2918901 RepID=A0AA96LMF5_9BACL|nr:phage integrase N-terminal SAM-like domain-containing protein [Paenibacillus sp. MBLB1832]WNR43679.1 phage integrase N-terminal SAM-like domain-containing protein [Paenibacillus sp. MBLB1832]
MSIYLRKINSAIVSIEFPKTFDRKWVELTKKLPGRRWVPERKYWTIPNENPCVEAFTNLFQDCQVTVDPHLIEQYPILLERYRLVIPMDPNELLDRLRGVLKLNGFSVRTQKAYCSHCLRLLTFLKVDIQRIEQEQVEQYLLHLLEKENSHSYVNQAISAIKYFLKEVCARHDLNYTLPRPKKEKKLPEILHPEEVLHIINALSNLKHKSLLYLAYSSGLRVGEIVRLQIRDIDSKRMVIHVRQAKVRRIAIQFFQLLL